MKKLPAASLLFFGLFLAVVPALAHHAFTAEFDASKSVTVMGVLTRLEWENPHTWFYVDVKEDNGNVVNWAFETASPNHIRNQDPQSRQDFLSNIGKAITVTASPAKGIAHRASVSTVKFASGKTLKLGGGDNSGSETENSK
jgi:hypothetical protein